MGATPGCTASRLTDSHAKIASTMWHTSRKFAGVIVLKFTRVGSVWDEECVGWEGRGGKRASEIMMGDCGSKGRWREGRQRHWKRGV